MQQETNTKRILRLPQVQKLVGLSRSSVYSRIQAGSFPRPVSLGGRAVGWLEHEIDQWLNQQINLSRMLPAKP